MRITEKEQELRKHRMLHAAYALFCEYGIDAVTMEKVASAANVSPNSIFRYFDNKATLLMETQTILWKEIVDCIIAYNDAAVSKSENGLDEIRVLLSGFEHLYRNNMNYLLFAYDYKAFLMRHKLKLQGHAYDHTTEKIQKLFIKSLERGQADGSILCSSDPPTIFLYVYYILRHFVEQMAVYNRIYDGANIWEKMFPVIVNKILEDLQKNEGTWSQLETAF